MQYLSTELPTSPPRHRGSFVRKLTSILKRLNFLTSETARNVGAVATEKLCNGPASNFVEFEKKWNESVNALRKLLASTHADLTFSKVGGATRTVNKS